MAKDKKKVVDAEIVEVETKEEAEEKGKAIKTGLLVAMTDEGDIHFNLLGDQNLLVVEGLLKYTRKHMDNIWDDRLSNNEQ